MNKKGLVILLSSFLIFLLIPSALAWNHSRGGWNLMRIENIAQEQEEDLAALMVQHRLASMRIQNRLQELQEEYLTLKRDWDADPGEVEEILLEMAQLQLQIFQEMQDHQLQLREILTEDQLTQYKEMLADEEGRKEIKKQGMARRGKRF